MQSDTRPPCIGGDRLELGEQHGFACSASSGDQDIALTGQFAGHGLFELADDAGPTSKNGWALPETGGKRISDSCHEVPSSC
ncbi:hypothetical protein ACFFX0_32470 [Citricoccus parietis]|uniref:Uncharacterized protein n=1 Tax=Citricoccus parietis TaxID=592307 RepID=A0ABV5G9J8_9MICC